MATKRKPADTPAGTKSKATSGDVASLSSLGYWVDGGVPDLTDILAPLKINSAAFATWLGPLLGDYRGLLAIRAQLPAPAHEARALRSIVAKLNAARSALRAVPARTQATLGLLLLRQGLNSHELRHRMEMDLTMVVALLHQAAVSIEAAPTKRGRKRATNRDTLLANVVAQLRAIGVTTVVEADEAAEAILVRCGVLRDQFSDRDGVRRARKRVRP